MKSRFTLLIPALISGLLPASATLLSAAEYRILPAHLQLDGSGACHRVLVQHLKESAVYGSAGDVVLKADDPEVAVVSDGVITAGRNGTTIVRATINGRNVATAEVTVSNAQERFAWTFRNHVQAVLAKQGCNSGACHGALAGKGGFRLSLRGYDTDRDYFNITTQQRGRRVNLTKPALSLLLTKPTTAVPHKGGQRLQTGTLNYRVLAEWIAAGAPAPADKDARLEQLSILPEHAHLEVGAEQPLIVRAHYSDGRIEDVTQWAKFTSANEAVATIEQDGRATIIGPGEGAITAWFGSQIVIARVTAPFAHDVAADVFVSPDHRSFIDELVQQQLQDLHLEPASSADDSVFIRRAFLDTIGTLPTSAEVRAFLIDSSPRKRDTLIDSLLSRSEFVDYWTHQWSDLLMINGTLLRPDAVKAYYTWIRNHVENNTPWDQFVREIVTAKGSSVDNGATNFYALHQTPEDMAENVSQAFLGLSIGCARCHNHPLEKWTNDQYYSFANLFARVRAKGWGGDPRNGDGKRTLVTVSTGELIQPRTGKPQLPTPLDAVPLSLDAQQDRREYLADWLVAPDNQLFARSITNRVWRSFMGVGLVEQVDDMRASNPASNEALLSALSQFLIEKRFNLRALMREILRSATYQRQSLASAQNEGDDRYYSRYFPRRLRAEVLLDAISQVTGVPSEFKKIEFPGADVRDTKFYADGTRAIQLYDSAVQSYFLKTFGRNQRRITCECERSDEPSMVQVLHISNGNTINGKLSADNNRLQQLLDQHQDNPAAMLDELFLSALSRYPKKRERDPMVAMLEAADEESRRVILEDIAWGILSSREFLFNH